MKTEAIWQAYNQQRVFRDVLDTYARPGDVRDLSDSLAGSNAQRAVLAALMDAEVTLADPHEKIAAADWRLLQARRGKPDSARYIVADGRRAPDFTPSLGTLESPEFGATLLLEIDAVTNGPMALSVSGPGIDGVRALQLSGLHPDWISQRAEWNGAFPLGVDLLLFDARRIVALPRTTHVTIIKGAN